MWDREPGTIPNAQANRLLLPLAFKLLATPTAESGAAQSRARNTDLLSAQGRG